ncbi:hypothetical protein KFZ58_15225 [Virgibacillus sp. NKC19-16]|uniref:hypothetical protein n=1 Tax=Virgibacillus salidurans TaxID=2831673 RepID=UPI001F334E01|nr:hypothetical protein [Virgibacillus sp. NKC19-16]UJL45723.1 hypothetical protein KFZ58_15225 [Virgibacillus sp. NKC19-16]
MEKNKLKAQMIETVENQIEMNDPKSTKDTFNRVNYPPLIWPYAQLEVGASRLIVTFTS